MNNQNTPQDNVPQGEKSAEHKYDGVYSKLVSVMDSHHQDEVGKLKSRIAELERRNGHLQEYKDKERERRSNFAVKVAELEAENTRYREALEGMSSYPAIIPSSTNYGDGYNDALKVLRRLAQQALNPKTKTDG